MKASSEIKKIEELKETNRILFEKTPLVMFIVNPDRKIIKVNQAAQKLLQKEQGAAKGLRGGEAFHCLHALDDPSGCGYGNFCGSCIVRNTVLSTFRTKEDHDSVTATIPRQTDKGTVILQFSLFTRYLDTEAGPGVLVGMEDVTEKKTSSERLQFLAQSLDSAPISVLSTDLEGRITYANQASEKLFGYTRRELLGSDPVRFNAHPNAKSTQAGIMDEIKKNGFWKGELTNRKKNSEIFHISALIYRINDRHGNFLSYVGFQEDITEKKKVEASLNQSVSELRFRETITNLFLTRPSETVIKDILTELLDRFGAGYGNFHCHHQKGKEIDESLNHTGEGSHIPEPGVSPVSIESWNDIQNPDGSTLINHPLTLHSENLTLTNLLNVPLRIDDAVIGRISLANKPGGFGKGSQGQLEATAAFIAPILHIYLEKNQAQKKLSKKIYELKHNNIALNVLLEKRSEDKKKLTGSLLDNFETLVKPYIERLKKCDKKDDVRIISKILESNINECLSPLDREILPAYRYLTQAEIQVADLIKAGKTSKEIASFLNISARTVGFHRDNIRKKMNIHGKKINLKSYLMSLSQK